MANLYLYQRVSSTGQLNGHGLTRQSDYFTDYLKRHPEHTVVKEYSDDGKSGYKGHNQLEGAGLHSFLKDFDAGLVPAGSILVTENLDRITRQDPMKTVLLLSRLCDGGVIIESLGDGLTYSTADSLLSLIMAAVNSHRAHEESLVKSDRIGKAWQSKLTDAMTKGKPHGRNCPRWLKLNGDGSAYEVIPEKAEVIKRLFALRLAGHGLSEIAKMMTAEGVPKMSPNRKNVNERWMPEAVRDLLQSPQLYGQYREKPDYYPPVVSYELFQQVAKTFSRGRGQQIGEINNDDASRITLLKGLLKCKECGRNLSLTGTGKRNHRGNYRCAACAVGIPALRLETRIIGACLANIPVDSPSAEKRQKEKDAISQEVATLTTQRKALTRALRIIESDDEADEIERDIKQRTIRIGELEKVLLEMKLQENSNGQEVSELQHLDWKNSIPDRIKAHQLIKDWLTLTGHGHTKILIDFEEMQATIYTVGEWDGKPETVHVYIGEQKQQSNDPDDGITDDEFWNGILNE